MIKSVLSSMLSINVKSNWLYSNVKIKDTMGDSLGMVQRAEEVQAKYSVNYDKPRYL